VGFLRFSLCGGFCFGGLRGRWLVGLLFFVRLPWLGLFRFVRGLGAVGRGGLRCWLRSVGSVGSGLLAGAVGLSVCGPVSRGVGCPVGGLRSLRAAGGRWLLGCPPFGAVSFRGLVLLVFSGLRFWVLGFGWAWAWLGASGCGLRASGASCQGLCGAGCSSVLCGVFGAVGGLVVGGGGRPRSVALWLLAFAVPVPSGAGPLSK